MKRNTPKVLLLISVILIIMSFSPVSAASDYDVPKVISIIYDDSGSMFQNSDGSTAGKKSWAYANYALQAFIGLMNNQDEVYITYMSNPTVAKSLAELGSTRQGAIDAIRNNIDYGGTPITALETAYTKLRNSDKGQQPAEYWLVVITDGEFCDESQNPIPLEQIEAIIRSKAAQSFSNGEKLKISYFAIGTDFKQPDLNGVSNITTYQAGEGEIFNQLSLIADKTSNRYEFAQDKVEFVDDTTISLQSEVPLLSIGILSQETQASIQSAAVKGGKSLNIAQDIKIMGPTVVERTGVEGLNGNAIIVDNKSENIPAGNYTIKFSKPIDRSSIKLMYKPALELRLQIMREDQEITNLENLREGEIIDIKGSIYELGTENPINLESLPADVLTNLTIMTNQNSVQNQKELNLEQYVIGSGQTTIKGSVLLDSALDIKKEIVFTAKNPVVYDFNIENTPELSLNLSELKDNTKGIRFTFTADGMPMTYDEVKDLNFRVELPEGLHYEFILQDEGSYFLRPIYHWPLFSCPTGALQAKATLMNTVEKQTVINLKNEPWYVLLIDFMLPILLILALLMLTILYIKKCRFERSVRICYILCDLKSGVIKAQPGARWRIYKPSKLSKWSWLPVDNRIKINSIVFYADRDKKISVKMDVQKLGINAQRIKEQLSTDIPINTNAYNLRLDNIFSDEGNQSNQSNRNAKNKQKKQKYKRFDKNQGLYKTQDNHVVEIYYFKRK